MKFINKKIILSTIIFILIATFSYNIYSKKDIDVEIGLFEGEAGGMTTLNTKDRPKDHGIHEYRNGDDLLYKIINSYEISETKDGYITLKMNLNYYKKESKVENWSREIIIKENGRLSFKPFKEIDMIINTKGF